MEGWSVHGFFVAQNLGGQDNVAVHSTCRRVVNSPFVRLHLRIGSIPSLEQSMANSIAPSTSPNGYVITDMPLVDDTDEEGEVQMSVYLPLISR